MVNCSLRKVLDDKQSAGEFYYGKVTIEAVEKHLNNGVKNGFLKLKYRNDN